MPRKRIAVTADEIIRQLGLKPLPVEGGFYTETYRADETLALEALPRRYASARALGTAIYFLLTPSTFSGIHRVCSDEIFHFYAGDPVSQLQLFPDGHGKIVTLGNTLGSGQSPQVVVPRNVWQGARLAPGGRFALLGATVFPGFELADYEHGNATSLRAEYPQFAEMITQFATGGV